MIKMTRNELIEKYQSGERNFKDVDLSKTNLFCANLSKTDLSYANLFCADLSYANLSCAGLSCANLSGAGLSYANLFYANLSKTDLSEANLSYANLSKTNLYGANLFKTKYIIPQVLLADWGKVSPELTAWLMQLDAESIPNGRSPSLWEIWQKIAEEKKLKLT
jgi:hypothetical protein